MLFKQLSMLLKTALVKEITNYALDLDRAADKNFTTWNIFTFRSEEN